MSFLKWLFKETPPVPVVCKPTEEEIRAYNKNIESTAMIELNGKLNKEPSIRLTIKTKLGDIFSEDFKATGYIDYRYEERWGGGKISWAIPIIQSAHIHAEQRLNYNLGLFIKIGNSFIKADSIESATITEIPKELE